MLTGSSGQAQAALLRVLAGRQVGATAKHLDHNLLTVAVAAVSACLVRYVAQVAEINALEPSLRALTDAELAEHTLRFKAALERNRHRCGRGRNTLFITHIAAASHKT